MNLWVLCALFSRSSSTALWKSTFGIFLQLRLGGSASGEVSLIPGQEIRFYTLICAANFFFLMQKNPLLNTYIAVSLDHISIGFIFFSFCCINYAPQRTYLNFFSKLLCDFLLVLWLEIHLLNFKYLGCFSYIYIYIFTNVFLICIPVR